MQREYRKLNTKARACMLVRELLLTAFLTLILGGVWYYLKGLKLPVSLNWIWLLIAFFWLAALFLPFFRYERYRYCLSEEDVEVREGFLFVVRNIVPIERIHKIALESGPIDRIFGLSKVIVTTAGGDVSIRFLEVVVAEQITDLLKTKINQYAREKREGQ